MGPVGICLAARVPVRALQVLVNTSASENEQRFCLCCVRVCRALHLRLSLSLRRPMSKASTL